jgi:hypothetical protein
LSALSVIAAKSGPKPDRGISDCLASASAAHARLKWCKSMVLGLNDAFRLFEQLEQRVSWGGIMGMRDSLLNS